MYSECTKSNEEVMVERLIKLLKDELDGGGAHLYSSTWKAGAGRTL